MASTYTTNSLSLLNGDIVYLSADADVDNKIATQAVTLHPEGSNHFQVGQAQAIHQPHWGDINDLSSVTFGSTGGQVGFTITSYTSDDKQIKRTITFNDNGIISLYDNNGGSAGTGCTIWSLAPSTLYSPTLNSTLAQTASYTNEVQYQGKYATKVVE